MNKAIIFYPYIHEYGGIERNIVGLAEAAAKRGLEPTLICFYDTIGMKKYCPGLTVTILGDHWNPFVKGKKLAKYLKTTGSIGVPLFFGTKAAFYAGVAGSENYSLHYTDPPSLTERKNVEKGIVRAVKDLRKRFSNYMIANGVKNAKSCLTMTKWNALELESIYTRKFDVVYQGGMLPSETVNTKLRCKSEILKLFSICRLADTKNLDWILYALANLKVDESMKQFYREIVVIIAGKGPEEYNLKQLAKELGVEDSVSFPGFLSAEQLEFEYKNSDLFLVPGRQGYGLPVLEALYREIPVILNKESRVSEILGSNPWIAITENSCEAFCKSMVEYIKKIRLNYPDNSDLKNLPTEDVWATTIGNYNHWWEVETDRH